MADRVTGNLKPTQTDVVGLGHVGGDLEVQYGGQRTTRCIEGDETRLAHCARCCVRARQVYASKFDSAIRVTRSQDRKGLTGERKGIGDHRRKRISRGESQRIAANAGHGCAR